MQLTKVEVKHEGELSHFVLQPPAKIEGQDEHKEFPMVSLVDFCK